MIQVSIIIVNYKNPQVICQCVRSIVTIEKEILYEIIVIDNNSQDNTKEELKKICPTLRWIQMGYNSGFAKANNAGIKITKGEYILYLNSDTILKQPVLSYMIYQLEHNKHIGIVGCRMHDLQNEELLSYHNCDNFYRRLWWRNPFAIRLFKANKNIEQYKKKLISNHENNHFVPWISGAIMLTKKEYVLDNDLYWDEDFFMYWEDVDLCYRYKRRGFRIIYISFPHIVHIGGGGENTPSLNRFSMCEDSKWLFIQKHHGKVYAKLYRSLLILELKIEYMLEKRKGNKINGILEQEMLYYGIIKK